MDTFVVVGGNQSRTERGTPWGIEVVCGATPRVAAKHLIMNARAAISRQVHVVKDELYYVLSGSGQLELGRHAEVVHLLSQWDVVWIPPGTIHRLIAGDDGLCIVEASTPEINDIVRVGDRYGRPVNPDFSFSAYSSVLPASFASRCPAV